jgi:hypothetical protein
MVASRRSTEKTCGRAQIIGKQLVCTFLPASPVGEQTGGEKIGDLTVPVSAAGLIVFSREQTAYNSAPKRQFFSKAPLKNN